MTDDLEKVLFNVLKTLKIKYPPTSPEQLKIQKFQAKDFIPIVGRHLRKNRGADVNDDSYYGLAHPIKIGLYNCYHVACVGFPALAAEYYSLYKFGFFN